MKNLYSIKCNNRSIGRANKFSEIFDVVDTQCKKGDKIEVKDMRGEVITCFIVSGGTENENKGSNTSGGTGNEIIPINKDNEQTSTPSVQPTNDILSDKNAC